MDRWSPSKRQWCCQHGGRGCPTATPPASQQAAVPLSQPKPASPPPPPPPPPVQKPLQATPHPYDCSMDRGTSWSAWSHDQSLWCCQHFHRGCRGAASSLPYDCAADYTTCWHCLQRRWSTRKRQWCCANGGKGCPPASTSSIQYDCLAGLFNYNRGWSDGKKAWCCKHQHKGCPKADNKVSV